MAKTVEVIADLTLELDGHQVKVTNDSDGDLVLLFSDKKTLGKFIRVRFALGQGLSTLNRANKLLKERRQAVILRVDNEDWIVLGHHDNPVIKYNKLAPLLLNKTWSDQKQWYAAAGIIGGGLVAALLYYVIRRRD